jgi:hypothetical protein
MRFSPTGILPRTFLRHVLAGLLCVSLFLGLMSHGQAQVSVLAGITPGEVSVGDHAQLTIQIRGVNQRIDYPTISAPDLLIEPSGENNTTQIDGNTGTVTIFSAFTYMVSATKAGEYEIPAQNITVAGQVYQTQPLKLKVVDGPSSVEEYQPILQIEVGKKEVFEGEVFPLTIVLMIHQNTNIAELPFPSLPRENFAMKRFQRNPDQTVQQMNGQLYRVFNYRTTLNAIKSGELSLGPAEAKVELLVPDGSGRRDPFGGISARQRTFKIKSNSLSVNSLPLPKEGQPANFSGAVGSFTLQIQAQPLRVLEGDPIAATIYINGTGNFESLLAPTLSSEDGWRLYPAKLVQENRNSGLEPGTVAFNQVLFPEKALSAIPPYVLTYFNPETKQYAEARTEAIPIVVQPNPNRPTTANASAGGPVVSGIRDFSFEGKSPPAEALQGTLSITSSMGNLIPLAQLSSVAAPTRWIHLLGGTILTAILAVAGIRKWRASAASAEEKAAAPPKASDLLRQLRSETSSLRKFYTLAESYLQAWLRESGDSFPSDAKKQELINRIRLRRDFYCYGAAAEADQAVPHSEHQEILDALKSI